MRNLNASLQRYVQSTDIRFQYGCMIMMLQGGVHVASSCCMQFGSTGLQPNFLDAFSSQVTLRRRDGPDSNETIGANAPTHALPISQPIVDSGSRRSKLAQDTQALQPPDIASVEQMQQSGDGEQTLSVSQALKRFSQMEKSNKEQDLKDQQMVPGLRRSPGRNLRTSSIGLGDRLKVDPSSAVVTLVCLWHICLALCAER